MQSPLVMATVRNQLELGTCQQPGQRTPAWITDHGHEGETVQMDALTLLTQAWDTPDTGVPPMAFDDRQPHLVGRWTSETQLVGGDSHVAARAPVDRRAGARKLACVTATALLNRVHVLVERRTGIAVAKGGACTCTGACMGAYIRMHAQVHERSMAACVEVHV